MDLNINRYDIKTFRQLPLWRVCLISPSWEISKFKQQETDNNINMTVLKYTAQNN